MSLDKLLNSKDGPLDTLDHKLFTLTCKPAETLESKVGIDITTQRRALYGFGAMNYVLKAALTGNVDVIDISLSAYHASRTIYPGSLLGFPESVVRDFLNMVPQLFHYGMKAAYCLFYTQGLLKVVFGIGLMTDASLTDNIHEFNQGIDEFTTNAAWISFCAAEYLARLPQQPKQKSGDRPSLYQRIKQRIIKTLKLDQPVERLDNIYVGIGQCLQRKHDDPEEPY